MTKQITLIFLVSIFFVSGIFAADKLPNIHIIATGGTIAGAGGSTTDSNYKPGVVGIDVLMKAVPEIKTIANITEEQFVKIGSQDMTDAVWLSLANRINTLLASSGVDGIVITHGTDTMEETAYFLNLTVKSSKPVVIVGAMRPSTSLSADGPLNLFNAVTVAANKNSAARGVLVVMNGSIFGAHGVTKTNTIDVQTFQSPNSGALGYLSGGKVFFNNITTKLHTTKSIFDVKEVTSLPRVAIVYGYSNVEQEATNAIINSNYNGIIHAGVGNGNIHVNLFELLVAARKKGIQIVRATRIPTGPVTLDAEIDDAKYGFIAAQELNPQKARILLMLALTKTKDSKIIQEYFMTY